MAFAEIAFGQIRALRQPASPRHFEIWYTYATGYNPSFNQTINEMLTRNGTLSEADIDQIYETYISAHPLHRPHRHVGSQVMGEIEQVMAMIGAAAGNRHTTTPRISPTSPQSLGAAADEPAVRAIVESLVKATKEMERNNQALEARLSASKQEITQLQENLEAVRTESLTDPLTSLANRKYFDDALAKAIAARKRQRRAAVADDDRHRSLQEIQRHLRPSHRRPGAAAGGDVGEAERQGPGHRGALRRRGIRDRAAQHDAAAAATVADHIRPAVMTKELMKRSTGEHLGRVTISIGVAALRPGDTPQSLIERADICLYAAKRSGRNRVISEADPEAAASAKVA